RAGARARSGLAPPAPGNVPARPRQPPPPIVPAMTIIDPARDLEDLRSLCGGAVALPSDDGYDSARQAFNLAVDQRPAAVVYPCNAQEVSAVVAFARARGLRVAPQATGHNAGPLGGLEGTILLKTSGMHTVTIDAERRIGRAEAGVLWEDV